MLGLQGNELARGQRWITIIRLLVYTFLPIISLGFLWKFQPPNRLLPLIGLIALALLLNLGQLVVFPQVIHWQKIIHLKSTKTKRPSLWWSFITWIPDLIMITGIVYYTGGPVSDFWFLYVLVIILGGLSNGTKGAFSAAAFSGLVYISMMYLSFKEVLVSVLPGESLTLRPDWLPAFGLKVFLTLSFFLLTAAIAAYVTQRYHDKADELENKKDELQQLRLDTDTILETIPAGILVCDFQGNILYSNKSGLKILGIPSYNSQVFNIRTLLESQPVFLQIIQDMLSDGIPSRPLEITLTVPNGNLRKHHPLLRPIGIDASYLQDRKGGQRGLVVYFTDLTQAKAQERDLRVADRLTAVGELARDLAHEIRNPLAVIRGSVEFMNRELHPGGQMERLMTGVLRESDRLNSLVYEFLDFSRLTPPECAILPVRVVFNSLQKLSMISDPIDIVSGLSSKTNCFADRDQLLRALETIITEISRQWEPPPNVQVLVAEPGRPFTIWNAEVTPIPKDRVGFVVRFPGYALSESEVDDLFRPFCHSDSKHRGLGLCTAHRIIQGHRGDIKIFNRLDQGLSLLILVPLPPTDNTILPTDDQHTTTTLQNDRILEGELT
jgi:two-component system sensor histidine kinase PilS (NtrC family)